ncbi:MAG TPA: NAD(P)/FAD-dependent oxidoreductase [Acidimicrobiales bacterium]|nr:NAD(P)/FAD-dependent oxidoreductase [Acidimicrobiales bacterium]
MVRLRRTRQDPEGFRPRVVVVGAGFGGLSCARALAEAPVEVTLVDRRNYHTFQPLLYQVATAGLDAESIAYAVRGMVHRHPALDFRVGTVVGADLDGRHIELTDGERLAYDYLVVAAGAVTADFGIPGVAEHSFPLKTLTDAMRLRAHLLEQFEWADAHRRDEDPAATTVVVVGGGPTGVELCGGLSELIHGVLARDHPHLDLTESRIVLVEATDRLLGGFSAASAESARATLESRGVEVRLGSAVEEVTAEGVRLAGGEFVPTRTLVWTAGVRANPLGAALGLYLSRAGRVEVGPDLSVPGRPEVFVVGDLAAASDEQGQVYPQLAPVAMQQGRHVAKVIGGRLTGRSPGRFHYVNKGVMATIGRNAAVAELPFGIRVRGFPAWIAWLALHLVYLIGFRNRATVLLDWSWNYLTYQRGARLIVPVLTDDIGDQLARRRPPFDDDLEPRPSGSDGSPAGSPPAAARLP